MMLTFKGKTPRIGRNVYIAPTAVIIGDVVIGDNASIWFNAVLRGDMAPISVGAKTNIQDNCTVHTDGDEPAVIGENVTVGHNAVVHGCTLEKNCLVGIGAVVLNGARVGEGAVVAANAVVREGQTVGPRQLVAGVPATFKKTLGKNERDRTPKATLDYLDLSAAYRDPAKVWEK